MDAAFVTAVITAIGLIHSVAFGQDMQPRVNITETDPPSDGLRMRGFVAKDAWLNCYVENLDPDLSVRWDMFRYRNGKEEKITISQDMAVEDNVKWSIEKPTQYSWRLRVKALELKDEGNYTCYVLLTNNNNRAESNRTLFVTDPPLILEAESSSDIAAKEGDFVPLRCNASGRPQPNIFWRREGNAILPNGGTTFIGSEYNIDNVQFEARGRYVCEAFNEVGYDRREIILSVQHAPKLIADPDRVGQAVGYQRTLVCHIDASPQPSTNPEHNQLYWSVGSQRVFPNTRIVERVMEGAFRRLTYELVFTRTEKGDYGMYQCNARNSLGSTAVQIELYETDEPQEDKQGLISSAHVYSVSTVMTYSTLLIFIACV